MKELECKFILSRFSFLLKEGEDLYLVYSSLSNSFLKISRDLYECLSEGDFDELQTSAPELFKTLRQHHIISDGIEDDDAVVIMEMQSNMGAYSSGMLGVTLAPTVSCNLRCPYCFESEKPSGLISKKTCEDVIDFINSHTLCKKFSLNWFGGEPLLGIDRIEYFLTVLHERVEKGESVPMYYHSMITNATLLNDKACRVFQKFPLDTIQVTFDGVKSRHDKMKFYKDGKGTFDEILDNLDLFTKTCPDTSIALRVNVDNNNYKDYLELYNLFSNRFAGKKISIYPGILRKCGDCDDSGFMTTSDVVRFNKWLRDNGIDYSIYPRKLNKVCAATAIAAYAIGPHGELYNCWEDMGQSDALIGSIYKSSLDKPEMLANFMRYGNLFNDETCRKCRLLPLCSGGCPKLRVANKLNGAMNDVCTEYRNNDHEALIQTLLDFYHSGKWKENGCKNCSCS